MAVGLMLWAALAALPSARADRATDVLAAAVRAEQTVSYRATAELRIMRGAQTTSTQTLKIANAPGNRRRTEVTAPPAEAGRLIVRNGRTEWEYWPRLGRVLQRTLPDPESITRQRLGALKTAQATLYAAYTGVATVAGRKCHVVTVSPPDGRLVSKRVWVDAENYVELKWERYSGGRKPSVTWAVRSISFGAVPEGLFHFRPPARTRVTKEPNAPEMPLAEAERQVGFRAVLPGKLPAGYALDRACVGVVRFGGSAALWLRFSNGVDSFSLFESGRLGKTPQRLAQATRWDTATRTYLLIGRLSQQDRQKIIKTTRD